MYQNATLLSENDYSRGKACATENFGNYISNLYIHASREAISFDTRIVLSLSHIAFVFLKKEKEKSCGWMMQDILLSNKSYIRAALYAYVSVCVCLYLFNYKFHHPNGRCINIPTAS